MKLKQSIKREGLRPLPRLLAAGMLAFATTACDTDSLVEVTDPARLRPEEFDNPAAVPQLIAGVRQRFTGGYSGFGDDSFLTASGVISDEMYNGDSFPTRNAADTRFLQPPVLGNISDASFARLQQARLNARRTYATIAKFTIPATARTDSVNQAFLRAIEGYVYVTLSEGWCGAVPFSQFPETGPIDPSLAVPTAPINTQQMNDTAAARFDEALALRETGTNRFLTRIGKARALLNNARYAEAAAAIRGTGTDSIPTSYVFRLEHSINASSQYNPIPALQGNGRYGVANLEGGRTATGAAIGQDASTHPVTADSAEGIAFRGLQDPRVPYASYGGCFSTSGTCWGNLNYPVFESDVPLASGVEARLIEAEAAMKAGNPDEMMRLLNVLRSRVAGLLPLLYPNQTQVFPIPSNGAPVLAPLTDPGTEAGRRQLLFQERALWLYNTGHRQGDLRRLVRHYGLTTAQAFPSGTWFRSGAFGNDVAYPVPFTEENNTKFVRSQCVTTQA